MTRKIDNIIGSINSFSEKYKQENWEYDELARYINKFASNNNANLTVNGIGMEYGGVIENNNQYILTIEIENANYYDIYMTYDNLMNAFGNRLPYRNEDFTLKAILFGEEIISPIQINDYSLYYDDGLIQDEKNYYEGKAYIIDINNVLNNINLDTSTVDLMGDNLNDYIDSISIEEYSLKKNVYYSINEMPFVNIKEVYFAKKLVMKDGTNRLIEVRSSLQPVGEAINILSDYYIVFYILAIILSIIIALIYSKLISKPLLKLTNVADKMANMDFSVKSSINSNDELGILSNSLNFLASNLDKALNDLTEANNQLVLDMEKEKKQEQVRKEFVANVSHELKTPLGIIKGFAEGIKDGIKKEKADYYIEVILDEIEKMNTLIMEMLELSKLEASNNIEKEEFSIKEIIDKTINILELGINNKGLNIQVKGNYNTVYGVRSQIEQVVINLISNAVKYCLDNTDIIITGEIKGEYNYIYIYNEGNKLSEEELESIWLRFYKIDKSHNRESGGTGLGLAIVKAILDGHNSDYGVMNKDKGVVFYFSLKV
ncbi:MAG: ATP-binding protein [Vallitalea sp.]|nr:ATP-binding protein [Vallitalea sp.]